jgi:hypothetical protein
MFDDEFLARLLELQIADQKRAPEYLRSENGLDKAARQALVDPFEILGHAEMHFDDGEVVAGAIKIAWADRRLKTSFQRDLIGAEIPTPNTSTAKIIPTDGASWQIARSHIDDVHIHRSTGGLSSTVTVSADLMSRKLTVTLENGVSAYHRVIYRGGNFDGYPHESFDAQSNGLLYDQFKTEVFWPRFADPFNQQRSESGYKYIRRDV